MNRLERLPEPWGAVILSDSLIDPANDYYKAAAGSEPSRRRDHLLPAGNDAVDVATFRRDVLRERAILALSDPDGEADAVAPLNQFTARQTLLEMAAEDARSRSLRLVVTGRRDRLDDRDLLQRLGADPTKTSGRVPCPAHGGEDRNLAWKLTPDGRALLRCWSHQCTFTEIVRAVA